MNTREKILNLQPGKMLDNAQVKSLLGEVPVQNEVRFNIPVGRDQRSINFRRWNAEGRTAWEVTN